VAGNITAGWKKSAGNRFKLKLKVPKETLASVYLPTTDLKTVKIDGKTLAEKPEIKAWQESGRWVVLAISSGNYQFECETDDE
jgi:alpha-L-rhamnosidase